MKVKKILIIVFFFFAFIFIFPCFVKGYTVDFEGLNDKNVTFDFGDIELRKNTFISVRKITNTMWEVRLASSDLDFSVVYGKFDTNSPLSCYNLRLNVGDEFVLSYGFWDGSSTFFSDFNTSSVSVKSSSYNVISILNDTCSDPPDSGNWFGYSNFDVKNSKGETIFGKTSFTNPFIVNKDKIQTGKFDKIIINGGDYKLTSDELYLLTYYYSENTDNPMESLYPRKEILLKYHGDYWVGANNEQFIYEVPLSKTGIDLVER